MKEASQRKLTWNPAEKCSTGHRAVTETERDTVIPGVSIQNSEFRSQNSGTKNLAFYALDCPNVSLQELTSSSSGEAK